MDRDLAAAQEDRPGAARIGGIEGTQGLTGAVQVKTDVAVLTGGAGSQHQPRGRGQRAKTGGVQLPHPGVDAVGSQAEDAVGVVDLDRLQCGRAAVGAGPEQFEGVVAHLGEAAGAGDDTTVGKDLIRGRIVQDEVGVVEDQFATRRAKMIAQQGAGGAVGKGAAGAAATTGEETDHLVATGGEGQTGTGKIGKDDAAAQPLADQPVVAETGGTANDHAAGLNLNAAVEGGGVVVDPGEHTTALLDQGRGRAADDAAGEGRGGVVATEGQRRVGGATAEQDGGGIAAARQGTDALKGRRVEHVGGEVQGRCTGGAEDNRPCVAQHVVDDGSAPVVDAADLNNTVLQGERAGGRAAAGKHGLAGIRLGPVAGASHRGIEQFDIVNGQRDVAVDRTDRLIDEHLVGTEDLDDVGTGRNAGPGNGHARLESGRRVVANQSHDTRLIVDGAGNHHGGARPGGAIAGQRPNQCAGEHEHSHRHAQPGAQAVHEHRGQVVVVAIGFHAGRAEGGLESRRPNKKPPQPTHPRALAASFFLNFMALRSLG